MPTYASYTDLNQFFSSTNVTDWADKDRDGVLSTEELLEIESGLLASEAIIDGFLHRGGGGYAAPFEAEAFAALPARLKSLLRYWTVTITGFHLYAWRGVRDKANPLETLYRQTLLQLKAVAEGQPLAGLPVPVKVTFGTGPSPAEELANFKNDAWDW
jgi:hypothetical protein